MRHYLTLKTGEIPNVQEVYEAFKTYSRQPKVADAGVDALVSDIRTYARYYCAMALGKESDTRLGAAFQVLRELRVDVACPLLLELYHDYRTQTLERDEFVTILRLIEAYVFRRAICAIPTNSLNKTFATFRRSLKKDRYLESVKAAFLLLPSCRRFPGDDEFKRELQVRDLYNFPRRSYWLRRFENFNRQEYVPVDEYTIEHIMPQNPNLSPSWREALGVDWKTIQETRLHTLGNLTLTGYNSEYSDRPFNEKRDMIGGFRDSPLRVNEGLGALDTWNVSTMTARGERLAGLGAAVWAYPTISSEMLDAYKAPTAVVDSVPVYSIEDQPHLRAGTKSRELFEALRSELLALDPCVTEEFLKLYVAFKAETNFVDVVPQAGGLRLSLNMPVHELQDPRQIARDVSNVGRWGERRRRGPPYVHRPAALHSGVGEAIFREANVSHRSGSGMTRLFSDPA